MKASFVGQAKPGKRRLELSDGCDLAIATSRDFASEQIHIRSEIQARSTRWPLPFTPVWKFSHLWEISGGSYLKKGFWPREDIAELVHLTSRPPVRILQRTPRGRSSEPRKVPPENSNRTIRANWR